jgi:5-methyltetrahydropteroyltriglutamate--homocysteine methyltransferase
MEINGVQPGALGAAGETAGALPAPWANSLIRMFFSPRGGHARGGTLMSHRTEPPFRADQVGSLLRPPELIAARDAATAGAISAGELRAVEDEAIAGVVALQERLGLESITDGEFRRGSYLLDFVNKFAGIGTKPRAAPGWDYRNTAGHTVKASYIEVTGKVRWERPILVEDYRYLRSLTTKTPKMTMPAPTQIHFFGGRAGIDRDAYPDLDGFWDDMVAAYLSELNALAEAGCTFVQIDETCLPKLADPRIREVLRQRGDDWEDLAEIYSDVMRRILAGVPAGLTVGLHACRGNSQGHWQASACYDPVAEIMFRKVKPAAYFLEFDSPRAGDFSPLAKVAEDTVIVLGLVSTKSAELEDADTLKRRIEEASRYVPLERLCLSPQCGFSSSYFGHPLTLDDEIRKIERVVQVAREVWG